MTVMGGSSRAPIAMPMTKYPLTTSTDRPVTVRASIRIRSGWRPAPMIARASYRASRTSGRLGPRRWSTLTSNMTGPSTAGSYPLDSSWSIHLGCIRPARTPSMTRSTPSTIRPAFRPGVTMRAPSARRSTRSGEILIAFALRGAPCGDWSHRKAAVRVCHPQHPPEVAEADPRPASLVGRVGSVLRHEKHRVALDRGGLPKADAMLAQVGSCLGGIPGFVHPGDRTDGHSSRGHLGLASDLPAL